MTVEMSYSEARANLAKLCDRVTQDRELAIIRRRKGAAVALIAADELASLTETAHLLRSPKNAVRLLTALNRALRQTELPQTVTALRRDVGFED